MTYISIVFDDILDDVDIIAIPDSLVDKIEELTQEFLHWEGPKDDPDYWGFCNGHICQVTETVGFVKWLNNYHCLDEEKAIIIAQHTNYSDAYKSVEF